MHSGKHCRFFLEWPHIISSESRYDDHFESSPNRLYTLVLIHIYQHLQWGMVKCPHSHLFKWEIICEVKKILFQSRFGWCSNLFVGDIVI